MVIKMKKRRGRSYKFTLKSYRKSSIMSAVAGVLSFTTIIAVIVLAFLQKGVVTSSQSFASMFATIMALVGLCVAILSLADKEQYHLFAKIGLVFNGITVAVMMGVVYLGVL
ncbi:MAG: DUF6142 family protein [Lachnospiraceae bacterium]